MPNELLSNYLATTAVASGGYTSGSGVLNVDSTAGSFRTAGNFRVVVISPSGTVKVILKVTGINSATQFAVTAEGTDASALEDDLVHAVITRGALEALLSDHAGYGTYANKPTGTDYQTGARYKCSDSNHEFIFNGTVWVPHMFGMALTDPTGNSWSWVNQDSGTVSESLGQIFLDSGDGDLGQDINCRVASVTPPYTKTFGIICENAITNYSSAGVGFRQSSDGKLETIMMVTGGGWVVDRWNSPTSFNSSPTVLRNPAGNHLIAWVQLIDDNTSRIIKFSRDGRHYWTVMSVTRTTFLTADQIMFCVNSNQSGLTVGEIVVSYS